MIVLLIHCAFIRLAGPLDAISSCRLNRSSVRIWVVHMVDDLCHPTSLFGGAYLQCVRSIHSSYSAPFILLEYSARFEDTEEGTQVVSMMLITSC